MGFLDDLPSSGVAPEKGSVFHVEHEDLEPEWDDDEEDVAPIEHNDIRSTPVSMPDFKKGRTPKLQKSLESFYLMLGTGIFPFDNQVGVVVMESAPNCASALNDLADKNPRLRKQLESLLSAGAYGAVISAHLPIAVIIATKYVPSLRENYGKMMADFASKKSA